MKLYQVLDILSSVCPNGYATAVRYCIQEGNAQKLRRGINTEGAYIALTEQCSLPSVMDAVHLQELKDELNKPYGASV